MEWKKLLFFSIKFNLQDKGKGWLIRRKIAKIDFVKKYKSECKAAFQHGSGFKDYKTTDGLHLVGLARKELRYENTTYAGDIYRGLWHTFQEINNRP